MYRLHSLSEIWRDGQFLAHELNDSEVLKPEERERLTALLTNLSELSEQARPEKSPNQQLMEEINEVLRRYKWVVELSGVSSNRFFFTDTPVNELGFDFAGARLSSVVIGLARHGLLDRVRRCQREDCKRWFYANHPKKIFCSTDCQQADWRSTPKFKESNRKYQRDYYRDVLSPKTAKHLQTKKKARAR
jgi:hypothetical protein